MCNGSADAGACGGGKEGLTPRQGQTPDDVAEHPDGAPPDHDYSSGTSSSATMLMILISGLMAGPAVSL
jgi:hypothetical protein